MLGADIDLDLVGLHAGNGALNDLAYIHGFHGSFDHFLETHVVTDFFTHLVKYLLNYRRRRGSPRGYAHRADTPEPFRLQLVRRFYGDGPGVLRGDLGQLLGIGRMMTTNDDHQIAFLAEAFRFLLPRPRRITYCIKNSRVCICFF